MKSKIILITGLILSFILINIFSLNAFYNNFIWKNLYNNQSYNDSIKYFNKSWNIQWIYNVANSLYKQKKYKEAIKEYKSIFWTKDKNILFAINHNIGNIFYKFWELEKKQNQKIKNWEESVKYYWYALNIKYNEETKKNLEFVLSKIKKEKKKKNEEKNKKKTKKESDKQWEKQENKSDKQSTNNKKNDKKQWKQSKVGDKQGKSWQKNEKSAQKWQIWKNKLSSSQEQALKKYEEALKKEQEKNQSNFNKVYRENNSNDPFSNFFNDPFFNNDLLNNWSWKKDW